MIKAEVQEWLNNCETPIKAENKENLVPLNFEKVTIRRNLFGKSDAQKKFERNLFRHSR